MKKATYEEFIQKLKTYNYDSIEEAAVAITEDGDFDRLEALLFIVHYGHGDEISKDVYDQLAIIPKMYLDGMIEQTLSENDGSEIFGYDEDADTYSIDD
ncbi:MAG: hypothetical protein EGQ71_04500 [Dialister sp.]|nr:hypothetical protein [Dialister sp.]